MHTKDPPAGRAAVAGHCTAAAFALLPRAPETLRRFAAASDPHARLHARARSYLGIQCADCHTEHGGGNGALEFDWLLPLAGMHALGELRSTAASASPRASSPSGQNTSFLK